MSDGPVVPKLMDMRTDARTWSLLVKVAVLVLLAVALVDPDLSGMKSKGLSARLIAYPAGLIALPLLCAVVRRWSPRLRVDWTADLWCTVPILVDLLGNRLDLFDRLWWWDDAVHVLMHGLITAGLLRQFRAAATRSEVIVAAAAFAGLSGLAWEVAEYLAFIRHGVELGSAYLDTLGDLTGGMVGSLLAGIAWSMTSKHRRQASSTGPRSNRRSHSVAKATTAELTTR